MSSHLGLRLCAASFSLAKIGDFTVSKTITSITWTSTGEGIAPGQFDEFALSVGPIPKAKSLNFSVQQGYSDNSTVDWDQIQTAKTEPERPAPTLQLNALAPRTEKASSGSANGLAVAALVLAAAGVTLGLRNTSRNV